RRSVDERQLRNDFHDLSLELGKLLDPTMRFDHMMNDLLPRCTAIVDGTIVPVRWRNKVEVESTELGDSSSSSSETDSDHDKKPGNVPFRRKWKELNCSRKKKGVTQIGMVVEWWCTLDDFRNSSQVGAD
ncbi:Hypothetical protein, putative, partial [Bodo saltans]